MTKFQFRIGSRAMLFASLLAALGITAAQAGSKPGVIGGIDRVAGTSLAGGKGGDHSGDVRGGNAPGALGGKAGGVVGSQK
jgi:hypothetical protein